MKKFKSAVMVARQNVMEKTHSRENTQETQVLKDFERVCYIINIIIIQIAPLIIIHHYTIWFIIALIICLFSTSISLLIMFKLHFMT